MSYREEYERWLADPAIDEATKQELHAIKDNEREIEERFYTSLAFGTGGLRGIIGAGTNRMNIYTVRKATQGLANYILAQGVTNKIVVIAHDCRRMSPEFCEEAALVLNANGIQTYVFDSLRPTPMLSFAVRHFKATAGIVVTASHNPPEYNGYKVYWDDGGQVPYPRDYAIIEEVEKVVEFSHIKTMPKSEAVEAGLFRKAGSEADDAYIKCVLNARIHPEISSEASPLKIVFTPLHGTGNIPVRRALNESGYTQVYVVKEQAEPDGNFPTVSSPNPEDFKAFTLAVELAKEKDADIILGTDPDADRVGVAVKTAPGVYIPLNGNMAGIILTEYLLSQKKAMNSLPENAVVISTIVSTDMTKAISASYGVAYMDVLTGFKYIGEKIKEFEQNNSHTFIFGFEESYGCLAGDYARDKDAVEAVLLICEAAAFYRKQDKTLCDVLEELYKKHGYFKESVVSITLKGVEGLSDMRRIMSELRDNPPEDINGIKITERRDYQRGEIIDCETGSVSPSTLPQSDVLYYTLENGAWCCVRPSGTEPKIKLYFGAVSESAAESEEILAGMEKALKERI